MADRPTKQPDPDALHCPSCARPAGGAERFCTHCGADLRGIGESSDTLVPRAGTGAAQRGGAPGPSLGSVIDGRYRLLEKLGEGGMGSVYKAEHVRMGKVVALKLMRPDATVDAETVRRFHQEARIVSRLSHPNTVSVFDFGELDDRSLYMAMEYVPGRDLAWLLRVEGALSERRALPIVSQVLRSLGEAHDAGIVHRDIKPGNVMVLKSREGDDYVKVVDFGIAKLAAARGQDRKGITGDLKAEFIGTPNYMSPEQVKGTALDGRSDLYSVGAMLFELLTGRPPFDGSNPLQVAARHLSEEPPSLADAAPGGAFGPELEAVVRRALAKEPAERFRSADEMRRALEAARDPNARSGTTGRLPMMEEEGTTGGLQIMRRDDWDHFERSLRRQRQVVPAVALAMLFGAAYGGFALYRSAQAGEARAPVTEEVEPNDGPNTANLIAPGSPVTGVLKRASKDAADADLFEFEVPTRSAASVRVSEVPNVNVALWLYGPISSAEAGKLPLLAQVDDLFLGSGEQMRDLLLEPGRYLLRVGDKRRADEETGSPRENSLDPYRLEVELGPYAATAEVEPNNTPDQPMVISSSRAVFGHSGARAEATRVLTADGATAEVGELFSDDFFEQQLPEGGGTGCLILSNAAGSTLSVWVNGTELPKLRALPEPERAAALANHLRRMAREKPLRVPAGETNLRCAASKTAITWRLRVEEGSSEETYAAVLLDDSPEGLAGLAQACGQFTGEKSLERCGTLFEAICPAASRLFGHAGTEAGLSGLRGLAAELGVEASCGDARTAADHR